MQNEANEHTNQLYLLSWLFPFSSKYSRRADHWLLFPLLLHSSENWNLAYSQRPHPRPLTYTTRAWVLGVPTPSAVDSCSPLTLLLYLMQLAMASFWRPPVLPPMSLVSFQSLPWWFHSPVWKSAMAPQGPEDKSKHLRRHTRPRGDLSPYPLPSFFLPHPLTLDISMVSAANDRASAHPLNASGYHWYHSLLRSICLYFSYSHGTSTIFPVSTYHLWSSFFSLTQPSFELTWIYSYEKEICMISVEFATTER